MQDVILQLIHTLLHFIWGSRSGLELLCCYDMHCLCHPPGLDSFPLGVVFGADFNEHLHSESLSHLYKTALEDTSQYPAFARVQAASADERKATVAAPQAPRPVRRKVADFSDIFVFNCFVACLRSGQYQDDEVANGGSD